MAPRSARRETLTFRRDLTAITLAISASLLATSVPPAAAGSPANDWRGPGCPPRAALRQIVDDAFAAAPAAGFFGSGRGSGAAGYSVALSRTGCGTFLYAVGVRDVEHGKAMNTRTRHHLGSLTKALTAAIILRLDDAAPGLRTSRPASATPAIPCSASSPSGSPASPIAACCKT